MKAVGAIIAGLLIIFIIWIAVFGTRVGLAPFIGRGNAEITIQSSSMRISAYNHFFNLCASIQANEHAIDAQTTALATATNADDKSRINQNIAALNANRGRGISTYNADAAKDYTIGQFRDSGLPYSISDEAYEPNGEKTSCAG